MKKFVAIILMFLGINCIFAKDIQSIKTVLFPFNEAIIASNINSSLQNYKFLIGEKFSSQSTIIELDNAFYALEFKKAEEQFNFAKNSYEDKKRLKAKKFISDYEFQKAEFDYQMAKIRLEESKLNLSYCTIKAPFDGKIVEILTKEYETVRIGQSLLRIINDSSLLAIMNVPYNYKKLTTVGENVKIKIDNFGIINGKIYEVSPQADHRTGTVRISVLINNSNGKLTSGMTGELDNGK